MATTVSSFAVVANELVLPNGLVLATKLGKADGKKYAEMSDTNIVQYRLPYYHATDTTQVVFEPAPKFIDLAGDEDSTLVEESFLCHVSRDIFGLSSADYRTPNITVTKLIGAQLRLIHRTGGLLAELLQYLRDDTSTEAPDRREDGRLGNPRGRGSPPQLRNGLPEFWSYRMFLRYLVVLLAREKTYDQEVLVLLRDIRVVERMYNVANALLDGGYQMADRACSCTAERGYLSCDCVQADVIWAHCAHVISDLYYLPKSVICELARENRCFAVDTDSSSQKSMYHLPDDTCDKIFGKAMYVGKHVVNVTIPAIRYTEAPFATSLYDGVVHLHQDKYLDVLSDVDRYARRTCTLYPRDLSMQKVRTFFGDCLLRFRSTLTNATVVDFGLEVIGYIMAQGETASAVGASHLQEQEDSKKFTILELIALTSASTSLFFSICCCGGYCVRRRMTAHGVPHRSRYELSSMDTSRRQPRATDTSKSDPQSPPPESGLLRRLLPEAAAGYRR